MKNLFVILFFALSPSLHALSVTTGVVTLATVNPPTVGGVVRYTIDWTSNTGGGVTATLTEINGTIDRVVYNPDDGASSPTANYDVTLADADGLDVLNSTGSNLSQSASSQESVTVTDGTTPVKMSTVGALTLTVANAGSAKGGVIRIYLRR